MYILRKFINTLTINFNLYKSFTYSKILLTHLIPIEINHAYSNTMHVITIYIKMNIFKIFIKLAKSVASDLHPLIQSF